MTTNLPAIPAKARALWRIVKAAGPLLISQSEKLSEAQAKHQLRLAQVDAIKEMMMGEARTISDVRDSMIKRYVAASPEERVRLRLEMEHVERELRQLGVYAKALDYVPENASKSQADASLDAPKEFNIWLDAFNAFAQKQNEPWRADLLARALAIESDKPGSIDQRALWFIGTLNESTFHAVADLLNCSMKLGGWFMLPNHSEFIGEAIPDCSISTKTKLGNILFMLQDLGLFGDLLTSQRTVQKDAIFSASYGAEKLLLVSHVDLVVGGVILTALGAAVAKLYEPQPNALGRKIFDTWLQRNLASKAVTLHIDAGPVSSIDASSPIAP